MVAAEELDGDAVGKLEGAHFTCSISSFGVELEDVDLGRIVQAVIPVKSVV